MKYLVSDSGAGYIFEGIMRGLKMGFQEVAKDILHEKMKEIKKEMGK